MRVLNFSSTNITELPGSIGSLKHLRYLNVSNTPIATLPESVTDLHGLETLKLKNCFHFLQLPGNMKNLTNLRHLELNIKRQISSMPPELGNLTKLQTLSAFIVGNREARQGIEELGNMSSLHGSICITNLENVVSAEEARTARLAEKLYMDKLEFQWNKFEASSADEVLQGLQPYNKIKELIITGYGGIMFSGWLSNPSFNRLESIYLQNCRHCEYLPDSGQLPALRSLCIQEMHELLLLEVSHGSPSLQSLTLRGMLNLQQFDLGDMPELGQLTITDCPKLSSLPLLQLSSLENLEIMRCPQLQLPNLGLPGYLISLVIAECDTLREQRIEDHDMIRTIQRVEIDYELLT